MTAPTAQEWAEERARELLNRLDSQQFTFTAQNFEDRVRDRKLAVEIIAAALAEAEARGMRSEQVRTDVNTAFEEGRAEGERIGREDAEQAARLLRQFAHERQQTNGRWSSEEQVMVDLAIRFEQRALRAKEKP